MCDVASAPGRRAPETGGEGESVVMTMVARQSGALEWSPFAGLTAAQPTIRTTTCRSEHCPRKKRMFARPRGLAASVRVVSPAWSTRRAQKNGSDRSTTKVP